MSGVRDQDAVNRGDVRRYDAIVMDTYNEGLIDVFCPSLADSTLRAVAPSFTPVGIISTPNPGDPIVVEESYGEDMAQAITWVGWTPAVQEATEYQQEGMTALVSPDRQVAVVLDDGIPDGSEDPRCALGRHDATEPAVLGDAYKGWMEDLIDLVVRLLDEVDTLRTNTESQLHTAIVKVIKSTLQTWATAMQTYLTAAQTAWGAVGQAATATAAGTAATASGAVATAMGLLDAVSSALTSANDLVGTNLSTLSGDLDPAHSDLIPDHLSDLVTVAQE